MESSETEEYVKEEKVEIKRLVHEQREALHHLENKDVLCSGVVIFLEGILVGIGHLS